MDYFPTLARFNLWANKRLYGTVSTLSEVAYRADHKAYFGSVHATLNHILLVDRSWTGWIEGRDRRSLSLDQILYDTFSQLRDARLAEDSHLIALVGGSLTGWDLPHHAIDPFVQLLSPGPIPSLHHNRQKSASARASVLLAPDRGNRLSAQRRAAFSLPQKRAGSPAPLTKRSCARPRRACIQPPTTPPTMWR